MDYGDWEGRTYDEVRAEDAKRRETWEAAPDTTHCPGGESGNEVAARVERFLTDLLEEQRSWHAKTAFRAAMGGRAPEAPPERRVLVVGHATTNRILLSVALGVDVRGYRRRFAQDQCNLTVLRWDADGVPAAAKLLLLNDTQHLRAPDASPWG